MQGQGLREGDATDMATMVSFKGIVGDMGWRALATQLYSPTFTKAKHRWNK